ncbi:5-oxoprolinase subunit PxpB [Cohnella sp. CFH 77786]|uniref:5-oxoprolinase subunit PxpB n=1 Tax=Cohnella sp. CFH 77786 TaxID=2662265 RepID=UPI001C60BE85|nr:5-oxoprolinase subunit PxpB [Cohnella sp. CFH 77786]MBW5446977.1 5-oxoprolinase subunit PxpB [Cohnella sp. CFH 77786]
MGKLAVYLLGDAALLFAWAGNHRIRPADLASWAEEAREREWTGVRDWVPAYRTLAVHLDLPALAVAARKAGYSLPEQIERLAERLYRALSEVGGGAPREPARVVRLPVIYGGADGPDLAACAARSGMTAERFVEAHASAPYEVAMIGFAPGFPYLSGLPESLAQPRKESPRLKVPAGSVGIAGGQTGVYPVESPGGWQLIGRTPVRLFRPEAARPFLLAPGDRVVFVPTEASEGLDEECGGMDGGAAIGSGAGAPGGTNGFDEAEVVFEVMKPGLLTTVQDLGRTGWLAYGVSVGGAMDSVSMRTANLLVGNPEDAAVLEMTLLGASFRMKRDVLIAACGAHMEARIDGDPLPMDRPVWLRAGAELVFGRAARGCRVCLAVAGGFAVPPVLGSRSTDARAGLGGIGGRALAAGDVVPRGTLSPTGERLAAALRTAADREGRTWASVRWCAGLKAVRPPAAGGRIAIRVLPGAEWDDFGEEGRRRLLESGFRVEASSDRMGLRLSGQPIVRERSEELSSRGVAPGTVQVPPGGQPIILAAGCQPTGGYPVIAHVIGADLPLLAQCRPGDEVAFRLADLEEAWSAWETVERKLRLLKAGVRNRGAES